MGKQKHFGCCDFTFFLPTSQHCLPGRWCMGKDRPLNQTNNSPDMVDKVRDVSHMLSNTFVLFSPFLLGLFHFPPGNAFSSALCEPPPQSLVPVLLFYFLCHFPCPYSNYKGLPCPLLIQYFILLPKNDSSFILKLVLSLGALAPCR